MTNLRTVTEKASDFAMQAKESVEEAGRSAGKKVEEARDETSGALHAAASSVRETGRKSSAAIDNVAKGAADRLEATASYVEKADMKTVVTGLSGFIRRNLAGSLVVIGALAFLAGSALGRKSHA